MDKKFQTEQARQKRGGKGLLFGCLGLLQLIDKGDEGKPLLFMKTECLGVAVLGGAKTEGEVVFLPL